jgi:hypothetical protein
MIHALGELCRYSYYLFRDYTTEIYVCTKFENGKGINRNEKEKERRS